MSLEKAAQTLASKGRNGDDRLVHMSKGEVAGLQALAKANGTPMTTNPDTGLPEAFSLKSLLPALAGFGLTALSGGALSPLMAAGIVGGGTALSSGSLSKGLMAGLGAYGGGGFGSSLATAGASGAGGLADIASDAVMQNAGAGAEAFLPGTTASEMAAGVNDAAIQAAREEAIGSAIGPNSTMTGSWNAVKNGAGQYLNDPMRLVNDMGGWKETGKTAAMAAAPLLLEYGQNAMKPGTYTTPEGKKGVIRDFGLDRSQTGERDTGSSAERRYFNDVWTPGAVRTAAGGGLMQLTGPQGYADGGVLGAYSDGGRMLRGPGDGVSDSIPATIDGHRPARLADGEFVIPARAVSELGNGSSEAGSRELYAMLDRIQAARGKTVGKGKVAVDAKARKALPA